MYTKKELIKALADLHDDAPIEINIITGKDEGKGEYGVLLEIEAVALNGCVEGQIVGYDIQE